MTVRDALNSALADEMRKDEKVYVIGEEVHNTRFQEITRSAKYLHV